MDVIGVIDLRGGQAVHARGGSRQLYAPVHLPHRDSDVAFTYRTDGDAIALARFYVDELGVRELYVADLDAIERGEAQDALLDRLLGLGVPLWLDAGVSDARHAGELAARGVEHVVVGLETLPSVDALVETVAALGEGRVAFSLDLRDGRPMTRIDGWIDSPETIARDVSAAGVGAVIVLDLSGVGSGTGVNVERLSSIRHAIPDIPMLAGGGIAGAKDLEAACRAGCDAVLAASALLDGRLTAADIRHARSRR